MVILIVLFSLSFIQYGSDDRVPLWEKLHQAVSKIFSESFQVTVRFSKNDELCPLRSPLLLGSLIIDESKQLSLEAVEDKLKHKIALGGKSRPMNCMSRQKIAFIIPYR